MKTIFRFLCSLGLLLLFSSTAYATKQQGIPVYVDIKTNVFVENTINDQMHELYPDMENANRNTFSLKEGDTLWLTAKAYADIFYSFPDYEETNGIKSIEYTVEKVKNCFNVENVVIPTTKLPNQKLNKIPLELSPGLYKITFTIDSVAEGYQDLFFECKNYSKKFSYYFSVEQENVTWVQHKDVTIYPTLRETPASPNTISFTESLPEDLETISSIVFYWKDIPGIQYTLSYLTEEVPVPEEFESGSNHIIYYAVLYTDNCINEFSSELITLK